MPLSDNWATPEDFATLFQYFWHRDFPIDQTATGAKRADWTIHIGMVVRHIADLMGLVARFERGSRKDALMRSHEGDEIAIEWEWGGVWGNELAKLTDHKVWTNPKVWTRPKDEKKLLKYAVLITYSDIANTEEDFGHVASEWEGGEWPLLLITIDTKKSKRFTSGKEFGKIQMSVFDAHGRKDLRAAPALPWKVQGTRWCKEY